MKIFKYSVPIQDEFTIDLPESAEVLCVQMQRQCPFIWVKVDDAATKLWPRRFFLHGTGQEVSLDANVYIGTFQVYEGQSVLHLFSEIGGSFDETL